MTRLTLGLCIAAVIGILLVKNNKRLLGITRSYDETDHIKLVEKNIKQDNAYMSLNYTYPYFENGPEELNSLIENWIANEYQKDTARAIEHYNNCLENGDFDDPQEFARVKENGASSYECKYKIAQLNNQYISLALHYSCYNYGIAQPFFVQHTFNYDVQKNKKIKLKDLFENYQNYLEKISNVCRAHLVDNEQGMDIEFWANDWQTEPTEENFNTFTFNNNHISFYFDWPWYHCGELQIPRHVLEK